MDLFYGVLPADLKFMCIGLNRKSDMTMKKWREYVIGELKTLGYAVKKRVACEYKGWNKVPCESNPDAKKFLRQNKKGFIDLVASRDGISYAIELDRINVRKRSIAKVKSFTGGIVILRDVEMNGLMEEINNSDIQWKE